MAAPPGLVAAYNFNENSGITVGDVSGNGNPGTISGAAWAAGKYGSALRFSGANALVRIADSPGLDLTNTFTIQAWVYPTSSSGWRTVVLKEAPSGLAYALYSHDEDSRPAAYLRLNNTDVGLASPFLPLNTWSHLAMTFDGLAIRLYVNGVQRASLASAGTVPATTNALFIGGNTFWGEYFAGSIDDVRLYNRVLTAAEITTDMNTPLTASAVSVTMTAPATGSSVSASVSVSANATSASGIAGVQFRLNGNNLGVEDTAAPYEISWNTATVPDGAHTLSAVARDTTGATAVSNTTSVTVANSGPVLPTISITSPASGATVSGSVSVSANATSASGIAGVQFRLDGNNLGAEDTAAPYQISWNTATVANGAHTLSAVARDTTGATAVSNTTSVTVANSGPVLPTISITSPASGATVSGSVSIAATAQNAIGVQFRVGGNNIGAEDTTAPFEVTWNASTVPDGQHVLTAVARNAAGTTTSSPVNVTVSSANPAVTGSWSPLINLPIVPVHSVVLHTGKVLIVDRESAGPAARVWDPVANTFTAVPNNVTDLFCSGHSALADGRILVVGGHGRTEAGTADVNIFDPVSLQWTLASRMAYKRWYPTSTTLPDGRVLATTGAAVTIRDYVTIPEVYDPVANTWTRLTGAPADLATYGQLFVLPSGKVACTGNGEFPGDARILDVAAQTWTIVDPTIIDGYSVMYEPGKVLKCGSSADSGMPGASTNGCHLIDFTSPAPAWQATSSMVHPRTHHNMTILPDGNVMISGGSRMKEGYSVEPAVYHPELWSPVTRTFTTMAPNSRPRLYHSEALLLPDGRVLSTGGGRDGPGVDQQNAEIFSPPYLFKGPRPTIGSAPATVTYGSSFSVATPDAASISAVVLMRPGSPTHGFDMDQRRISMAFQAGAGTLTVEAPVNANVAPPGYYMLFLINTNGVPSVATFLRIPLASQGTPPTAPISLTATGHVGRASLSWQPSTSAAGIVNYNVYRSTTPGFTPAAGNQVGQTATTSYNDVGLSLARYYYRVTAVDGNQLVSASSNEAFADVGADTLPPQITITSPSSGTVSGTVQVSAAASDETGIAGVQFLLNGANFGSEVVSAPYTVSWNTSAVANGSQTLTARARDFGGNTTVSSAVIVTVSNTQPSGLVAAYSFNEGSGSTTADRSGSGNNGTIMGATWSAAGKYGNALSFSGSARVNIPDSASLDLTTAMTLMAWVSPLAHDDWRTVLLKTTSNDLTYALYSSTDVSLPGVWVTTPTTHSLSGPSRIPLRTWTHLAATYDGASLRFFVNGVQVGSQALTTPMAVSSGALQIGGNTVWGEYFTGLIDEIRIYNRALTSTEMMNAMNTPITP